MTFILKQAKTWRDLELVALLDQILFVIESNSEALDADELHGKDVIWWLAYADTNIPKASKHPVGFCGMVLSSKYETSFIRAGVLEAWRKQGLQKLMIKKRLAYAKRLGYRKVQTYVHGDNVASTRALLSCGFVPNKASQSKRDGLWLYVEAKT